MKDNIISWVCSAVTILTGSVAEDVTRIILLVLGCLSAAVSLALNIWIWHKKAMKDGKIDEKEAKELKDIVEKGTQDIKDAVNKEEKDNG